MHTMHERSSVKYLSYLINMLRFIQIYNILILFDFRNNPIIYVMNVSVVVICVAVAILFIKSKLNKWDAGDE